MDLQNINENNVQQENILDDISSKKQNIKKTENLKEYHRNYRLNNKEKIKEYYKNWISKPENDPLKKIRCEKCGSMTVKSSITKHRLTKKCNYYNFP